MKIIVFDVLNIDVNIIICVLKSIRIIANGMLSSKPGNYYYLLTLSLEIIVSEYLWQFDLVDV